MNYLWNPLRIVCIVMVKLFKANSDVIWRLWLWSCACLRRDAWSTVKMTCLVNYPQPEGWRHPGFYDKTTTVTDLMPVLAGQPSSFCQCPSTYFCEGCWVTISCVLVVPVSLPDFSTDLYWSTCLLLTHTSIALDTCHLPIQVGPREGCCTLFSRSDSRFQVAQNVRGIWQPWTHNFSGDLKVLLTLFVIVSICFPQLPARFFMVSWLHWGVGVLPISYRSQVVCTVPVLLQRVVKLPVSRMLVVGPLQWHSDVEKLFPPHVCQVESLLFRLLRWFSVCWLPWWLLQWLGPWPGWSWSQGAGESCSFRHGLFVKPSSEAVMLHLAPREMHDARGWVWAPGVLAYGMGACEIRWIELSNYWKVGSPSGVHVFLGVEFCAQSAKTLAALPSPGSWIMRAKGRTEPTGVVSGADWGCNALWESSAAAHERSGSAWRPVRHFFAFFLYLRVRHVGMCLSTFQDMQEATESNYLELLRNQAYLPDHWNHDYSSFWCFWTFLNANDP